MNKNFEFLVHACIRFDFDGIIVYTDPYMLEENRNDADIVFVTHDHFDHYSVEDIRKVVKNDTVIVVPEILNIEEFESEFTIIRVANNYSYECRGIKFETIPAYNLNKQFHPKAAGGVGYILEYENIRYYIAGDTDVTEENRKVKCDVAYVPVGGTYTMDCREAAQLVNELKPKIAVPIHYGKVVGSSEDADEFEKLVEDEIKICRK